MKSAFKKVSERVFVVGCLHRMCYGLQFVMMNVSHNGIINQFRIGCCLADSKFARDSRAIVADDPRSREGVLLTCAELCQGARHARLKHASSITYLNVSSSINGKITTG